MLAGMAEVPNTTARDTALSVLAKLAGWRADDRDDWLRVGMALHSASPDLLDAWDEWSRQGRVVYREAKFGDMAYSCVSCVEHGEHSPEEVHGRTAIIIRQVAAEEFLRTGVMAPAWAADASFKFNDGAAHWYIEVLDTPRYVWCGQPIELPVSRPDEVAGRAFVKQCPGFSAGLDWLEVDEEKRRRGIGTKLLNACRKRWPGITGTTPDYAITPEGEKLCEALERGQEEAIPTAANLMPELAIGLDVAEGAA